MSGLTGTDAAAARADALDVRHLGAEHVERYLRRHGLAAEKRLSQHHLVDGETLEAILDAAEPRDRTVLEIGSGIGILTGALLSAGARRVVAVEIDRRLVRHLSRRFGDEARLALLSTDILDVDIHEIVEPPYDVVANLPYHITSPVLHRLLGGDTRPERFVLMLQREVAERISAPPGGMSYLSVFVQYHALVSLLRVVPASAFEPPPKVDSAVVVGEVLPRQLTPAEEENLWRLVQAGFRERRKMVHNVLTRQLPQIGASGLAAAFDRCAIAPDRRPQTLALAEWRCLSAALGPLA